MREEEDGAMAAILEFISLPKKKLPVDSSTA
jgi:hypothetical protein